MSISNINPNVWGPHAWKFLHYITLAYPSSPTISDKQNTKIFFESMSHILPCEKCKIHFQEMLKNNPLTEKVLSSKWNLVNWLLMVHNKINLKHGKKEYTFDQLYREYILNSESDNNMFVFIFLILLLVIIFGICIIRR